MLKAWFGFLYSHNISSAVDCIWFKRFRLYLTFFIFLLQQVHYTPLTLSMQSTKVSCIHLGQICDRVLLGVGTYGKHVKASLDHFLSPSVNSKEGKCSKLPERQQRCHLRTLPGKSLSALLAVETLCYDS